MRYLSAAAAFLVLVSAASPGAAAPRGSIGCVVEGMPASERSRIAKELIDKNLRDKSVPIQAVGRAAIPCSKANHWTNDQLDHVTSWTIWKLMEIELRRKAGLADADVAILRAYAEANPAKTAGLNSMNAVQSTQLVAELRARGAHLHDDGGVVHAMEMFVLYLQGEMKSDETPFAAS